MAVHETNMVLFHQPPAQSETVQNTVQEGVDAVQPRSPPAFLLLPAELRLRVYTYMIPNRTYPVASRPAYTGLRLTCRQIQSEFDHEAAKEVRLENPFLLPDPCPTMRLPQCHATLSNLDITISGHWRLARTFFANIFLSDSVPWVKTLKVTCDATGNYDSDSLRGAFLGFIEYIVIYFHYPTEEGFSAAEECQTLVVRLEASSLAAKTWVKLYSKTVKYTAAFGELRDGHELWFFELPRLEVDEDQGWLQATWGKRSD